MNVTYELNYIYGSLHIVPLWKRPLWEEKKSCIIAWTTRNATANFLFINKISQLCVLCMLYACVRGMSAILFYQMNFKIQDHVALYSLTHTLSYIAKAFFFYFFRGGGKLCCDFFSPSWRFQCLFESDYRKTFWKESKRFSLLANILLGT